MFSSWKEMVDPSSSTCSFLSLYQIFFDDSTRNIATAKVAGLRTVLVRILLTVFASKE